MIIFPDRKINGNRLECFHPADNGLPVAWHMQYKFFYIVLSSSIGREGHGMQTKKPLLPTKTAGKHWTIPVKLIIFI